MFQKGELRKITLEMIMPLEFTNSTRLGLVKRRVLCLHMFHQTSPWPSIVPFSPKRQQLFEHHTYNTKHNVIRY
jgi:hypothetical protein